MMTKRGPKRKLPPGTKCKICDKLATAVHYNCIACEGCKGFFRRTIINKKRYPECKVRSNVCNKTPGTRACQWCRYQKCLLHGMKPELVNSRIQKEESETQNIKIPEIGSLKIRGEGQTDEKMSDNEEVVLPIFKENIIKILSKRYSKHNTDDYDKTIARIELTYRSITCCPNRLFHLSQNLTTSWNFDLTEVGFVQRFQYMTQMALGTVEAMVTFIASVDKLKTVNPQLLVLLCKSKLIGLLLIKSSLEYSEEIDAIRFSQSGDLFNRNAFKMIGFSDEMTDIYFKLCKRLKNMIVNDFFVVACFTCIRLLDVEVASEFGSQEKRKITELRTYFYNVLEYYCIKNRKPFVNLDLILTMFELTAMEKNLLRWVGTLRQHGIKSKFETIEAILDQWLIQNKNLNV